MAWYPRHPGHERDSARLVAVTVPNVVAEFVERLSRWDDEPPYRLERPVIETMDDALAWLHDQPWTLASDATRRRLVKWLLFLRYDHRDDIRRRGGRP